MISTASETICCILHLILRWVQHAHQLASQHIHHRSLLDRHCPPHQHRMYHLLEGPCPLPQLQPLTLLFQPVRLQAHGVAPPRTPFYQCTNLGYLVQFVFAREGPVRLPQHLQYINRSNSPLRSLSLLRSPCSPLLTPRFPFPAVPVKACKPSNPKNRYRISGARASDHTLTLLF